jgi:hypothetical protein
MFRYAIVSVLFLIALSSTGCGAQNNEFTPISPTIEPAASPTPTIFVVRTVVGVGREIRGPLIIEGNCVRVNGEALAWKPVLSVTIDGDMLRVHRKWNGQVSVLHAGDMVRVYGSCILKQEGEPCGTPSMAEENAVTGCDVGPYFVVGNIRKMITPTPPPLSP